MNFTEREKGIEILIEDFHSRYLSCGPGNLVMRSSNWCLYRADSFHHYGNSNYVNKNTNLTFSFPPPVTLTLYLPLSHHRMMSLPTCTHWLYDQTTHTKSRLTTSVRREVAWKTTGTSFHQKPFLTQRPRNQRTGMTPAWLTTLKTQSRRSVAGQRNHFALRPKPGTLLLLNFLQFILLIKLSTMADFSCECTKVFVGCLSGLQLLVPLHTHPTQKVFEEHTRYFSVHFIGLGQAWVHCWPRR